MNKMHSKQHKKENNRGNSNSDIPKPIDHPNSSQKAILKKK